VWMQHWYWLGVDNLSGAWYGFWSGIGSDIPIFAAALGLLANFYVLMRHHNCEVHRCWRIVRHQVETTGHRVCRKHHPEGAPTAQQIRDLHFERTNAE
jgi:hypothetical protein